MTEPTPQEVHRTMHIMGREARDALDEYVEVCCGMTLKAFAKEPGSRLSQLSAAQYRHIVETITIRTQAGTEPTTPRLDKPKSEGPPLGRGKRGWPAWGRLNNWVSRFSLLWTVSICALLPLLAGMIIVPGHRGPEALVRNRISDNWPACAGFLPDVDGCLLVIPDGMTWQTAATLLAQPETELRRNNRHLSFPTAGQRLVVWRGRGRLEN